MQIAEFQETVTCPKISTSNNFKTTNCENSTHEECTLGHLHSHVQTHKVCRWRTAHMGCDFERNTSQPLRLLDGRPKWTTK